MRTQKKGRIAFAVCGSFCTLEAALAAAQQLTEQGWELLPIMSFAAKQDTRFGTGKFWQERLEALTSMQCWTHCRPWSRLALKSWSVHW